MNPAPLRVLFLCSTNTGRSQMAEALLNALGHGRFTAFSAGTQPQGAVQPEALELIAALGLPTNALRSKSWREFDAAAPMDMVITVCDDAAGEASPTWPGHPEVAHWHIPDPARHSDSPHPYKDAWLALQGHIRMLCALPDAKLQAIRQREATLTRAAS